MTCTVSKVTSVHAYISLVRVSSFRGHKREQCILTPTLILVDFTFFSKWGKRCYGPFRDSTLIDVEACGENQPNARDESSRLILTLRTFCHRATFQVRPNNRGFVAYLLGGGGGMPGYPHRIVGKV